jgi:DNA-directed RNA polymerase subunit omega
VARVTVEDCLEKVNNRFALVILVAKRAKQLLKGVQPVVAMKNNKYIVTSLREVAIGKVAYDPEMGDVAQRKQVEADLNR